MQVPYAYKSKTFNTFSLVVFFKSREKALIAKKRIVMHTHFKILFLNKLYNYAHYPHLQKSDFRKPGARKPAHLV